MKFKVKYVETWQSFFTVEAESEEEAMEIVMDGVSNEQYETLQNFVGESFKVVGNEIEHWDEITNLMNPDIREQVHRELAPCSNEEFLRRYCELDPSFRAIFESEFGKEVIA